MNRMFFPRFSMKWISSRDLELSTHIRKKHDGKYYFTELRGNYTIDDKVNFEVALNDFLMNAFKYQFLDNMNTFPENIRQQFVMDECQAPSDGKDTRFTGGKGGESYANHYKIEGEMLSNESYADFIDTFLDFINSKRTSFKGTISSE
jgi:hypothetical protein